MAGRPGGSVGEQDLESGNLCLFTSVLLLQAEVLCLHSLCAGPGPSGCDSALPGSWPESSGPLVLHPKPWPPAGPAGC